MLDFESLSSEAVLNKLAEVSEDAIFESEPSEALDAYEFLQGLYGQGRANVRSFEKDWRMKMESIIGVFFWKALPMVPTKQQEQAVQDQAVFISFQGVNLIERFDKILGVREYNMPPLMEKRKEFIYSLENNTERLGGSEITEPGGNSMAQTLKNWLQLYNQSVPLVTTRGRFEQVKFFQNNENIKKLDPAEKTVLESLIQFYDWLLFPSPGPRIIGGPESNDKKTPYTSIFKGTMPSPATAKPVSKPLLPKQSLSGSDHAGGSEIDVSAKRAPLIPLGRPAPRSLADIQADIESKKQKAQVEIDKKLEELKRKIQR